MRVSHFRSWEMVVPSNLNDSTAVTVLFMMVGVGGFLLKSTIISTVWACSAQIPCESIIYSNLFVQISFFKGKQITHLIDAPNFPVLFSLLSPLLTPVQRVALKHMRFVCQHINLRGRRLVSPRSLLFCRDAGSIQTVWNVVSVSREIQFLDQVNNYVNSDPQNIGGVSSELRSAAVKMVFC